MAEALDLEEEPASRERQESRAGQADRGGISPHLRVAGFEGPIDCLVELVRRQRVDFGPLSILTLTDKLVVAIESRRGGIWLERRADWLVMASQPLLLRPSCWRLRAPRPRKRRGQRPGSAWSSSTRLPACEPPLPGCRPGRRSVRRCSQSGKAPRPQAELYVAFLEATLTTLEGRERQGMEAPPTYRPTPPDLWRIQDAVRRITELLRQNPSRSDRPLHLRAALASTLVAGLELARSGDVVLQQKEAFTPILIARVQRKDAPQSG